MPEIGATLREARMRARTDISEIESETKIRAKYLRALENEEWDLLPGPTYVKSFLRTYAEALGLDAKLLLEEYKLRHERLSDHELHPISPRSARERQRQQPRGPLVPRWAIIGAVFVALIVALYLLGRDTGGGGPSTAANTIAPPPAAKGKGTPNANGSGSSAPASGSTRGKASKVRLELIPTAPVYVCLKEGRRVVIKQRTLAPGTSRKTYRATSFRVLLGNGSVTMKVNGKPRAVPQVSKPIAYSITSKGRRVIPATQAICSAG